MMLKVGSYIADLFSRIPSDNRVVKLTRFLDDKSLEVLPEKGNKTFGIGGVDDPLYLALLSMISIDVRKKIPSRGAVAITRSVNGYVGVGLKGLILRSGIINWLKSLQLARVYHRPVGNVGYRSSSFMHPLADLYDFYKGYQLWSNLQSSEDITKLVIDDILVGDLVIDSYLRFRPSPFFDVQDKFVLTLIWQVYRDIRRANNFFLKSNISFYLSSLTTYTVHGVAVRCALNAGVPVYLVSSGLVFGKKLSNDDYFHTPNSSGYRSEFEGLECKADKLQMAEEKLGFRLSGGIDDATSYMRTSAYTNSDENLPDVDGAVIIFLHDFYDSPHVYDEFIFPDFWSWIIFTIDTLIESETPFWIKPHPNQIALSDEAFQLLLRKYPYLKTLSPRITNSQLVNGGIICGVTAYGTVAHELAYMGVPSICCAKHPHHSFDFCRTAKDINEYQSFLQSPDVRTLSKNEMQHQALAFYYMHNFSEGSDTIALRHQFNNWFREVHNMESTSMLEELSKFQELRAYNSFIEVLVRDLTNAQ